MHARNDSPSFNFQSFLSFWRDNRSIGSRRSILSWQQLWRAWNISVSLVCYCRESARTLCLCVSAFGVYGFNLTAGISTKYTSGPHSTSCHISAENAAKFHSHKKKELSFTLSLRILHFYDAERFNISVTWLSIEWIFILIRIIVIFPLTMTVLHEQHNTAILWSTETLHPWEG